MLKVLTEPSATAVATAAFTGLRLGELRGLEWEIANMRCFPTRSITVSGELRSGRLATRGSTTGHPGVCFADRHAGVVRHQTVCFDRQPSKVLHHPKIVAVA